MALRSYAVSFSPCYPLSSREQRLARRVCDLEDVRPIVEARRPLRRPWAGAAVQIDVLLVVIDNVEICLIARPDDAVGEVMRVRATTLAMVVFTPAFGCSGTQQRRNAQAEPVAFGSHMRYAP
jgi:hypothetical protein